MELTSLAYLLMLALGVLGVDTVMHSRSIVVDVVAPQEIGTARMAPGLVSEIVDGEVRRIAATRSVIADPNIMMSSDRGVTMALAELANVRPVAEALQSRLGYDPTSLNISVFTEAGVPKVLVSGSSRKHTGDFEDLVTQRPGESITRLVRRAVLLGLSKINPYMTALYLVHRHAGIGAEPGDDDFSEPESLARYMKAALPPSPISSDRALYENLLGIIALFHNDADAARRAFAGAVASDPKNVVAALNLAFSEIQTGTYAIAASRMNRLIEEQRPDNQTLLSVAYASWAVACIGMHDDAQADRLFAKAITTDPHRAPAIELWSEFKRRRGETARADELHQQALAASDDYSNYAEVAVLYFAWAPFGNQPIRRNDFRPSAAVSFR